MNNRTNVNITNKFFTTEHEVHDEKSNQSGSRLDNLQIDHAINYESVIIKRIQEMDPSKFNQLYDVTKNARDTFNQQETKRVVDQIDSYTGSVIGFFVQASYRAGKYLRNKKRESEHASILVELENNKPIPHLILNLLEGIGSACSHSYQFQLIEFIAGRDKKIYEDVTPYEAMMKKMSTSVNKNAFAKEMVKSMIASIKAFLALQASEKNVNKVYL